MGNYKSRPGNSCSEEHLKKVTELQNMVRMKIMADLTLIEPGQMTELQVRRVRVMMIISWVLRRGRFVMIISWVLRRVVMIISWVLQESCCRAEVERVAVFANSDSVQELTGAGLGVAHLCVQAVGQAGG